MIIPYEKIKRKAQQMDISPYPDVKEYIGYRNFASETDKSRGKICKNCELLRRPTYQGVVKNQCEIIGLSIDKYASVNLNGKCQAFKKI